MCTGCCLRALRDALEDAAMAPRAVCPRALSSPVLLVRCGPLPVRRCRAPEVVQQQTYSLAVDIWSLGVILYILLTCEGRVGYVCVRGCVVRGCGTAWNDVLSLPWWAAGKRRCAVQEHKPRAIA